MEGALNYFSDNELKCRCGCGLLLLHPGFRSEINLVRDEFGGPLKVNSCCRCASHNVAVKGHIRSLHVGDFPAHADKGQLGTLGIDFDPVDGNAKGRLFGIMWKRGWSLGWNKNFLHGDLRIWIGMSQTTFEY
jgi:hypothetical protein